LSDLPAHSPASPTIAVEEKERLLKALAALPESQREVVILHHLEGLKFRSIAKSRGESINTIQSRYRYGMRKMRTFFAEGNENV
jgi:RNA polymerase sigma-70 factor (ECF subfamily)